MSDRHDPDRPLPRDDDFNVEAHVWLAPRADPSRDPRPSANGDVDHDAVERAARFLDIVIG